MNQYVIVTDSAAELPWEALAADAVGEIHMPVLLDSEDLPFDSRWPAEKLHAFYERLRAGSRSTTAQITPEQYKAAFQAQLDAGRDVLYVGFSSGMSGSMASAVLAAEEINEACGEKRVFCADSLRATLSETMVVLAACANRARGMSAAENVRWIAAHTQDFHVWFAVEDLNYLQRGGRISAATAFFGGALSIRPLMRINDLGKLEVTDKIRGEKAILSALLHKAEPVIAAQRCPQVFITHGDAPERADNLSRQLQEAFPQVQITTFFLNPVIGTHTGPSMLAIAFVPEEISTLIREALGR